MCSLVVWARQSDESRSFGGESDVAHVTRATASVTVTGQHITESQTGTLAHFKQGRYLIVRFDRTSSGKGWPQRNGPGTLHIPGSYRPHSGVPPTDRSPAAVDVSEYEESCIEQLGFCETAGTGCLGRIPGGLSHPGPVARPCETRGMDGRWRGAYVSCGYQYENPPIRLLLAAHIGLSVCSDRGRNTKTLMQATVCQCIRNRDAVLEPANSLTVQEYSPAILSLHCPTATLTPTCFVPPCFHARATPFDPGSTASRRFCDKKTR